MRIGIYYVVSSEADHARRLADFPRIKALGVNAIATYLLPTDKAFVDKCRAAKIDIIVERGKKDTDLSKLKLVLERFGDAIKGVIVYDDVDNPKSNYSAAEVRALVTKCRKMFGNDYRYYLSGGYVDRIGTYRDCDQDEILFQGYPIGNGDQSCADAGSYYWRAISNTGANWSPAVQAFAWQGQRYPTEQEVRSMTYQALALCTSEVWYYTYYDPANDMTADAARRNQLRRIVQELKLAEEFWG